MSFSAISSRTTGSGEAKEEGRSGRVEGRAERRNGGERCRGGAEGDMNTYRLTRHTDYRQGGH